MRIWIPTGFHTLSPIRYFLSSLLLPPSPFLCFVFFLFEFFNRNHFSLDIVILPNTDTQCTAHDREANDDDEETPSFSCSYSVLVWLSDWFFLSAALEYFLFSRTRAHEHFWTGIWIPEMGNEHWTDIRLFIQLHQQPTIYSIIYCCAVVLSVERKKYNETSEED